MEWVAFQEQFEAFVGVNLWTMVFAWINLLILYIVLKKILFKPVKNMIDSRQSEVDVMYDSAHTAEESALKMKEEYEEKLGRAEEESEEILRTAQRKALLKEEDILKEANDKAQLILERAEAQIELEKKRAINEVKDEVSGLAVDIAGAIIERDVSREEHKALIDEFIDKIGEEE